MNTQLLIAVTIVLAVLFSFAAYMWMKEKTLADLRPIAYRAILEAEHIYRHGQNVEKLDYVARLVRNYLPGWLSVIVTQENLEKLIDLWFTGVKALLDDGKDKEKGA